MPTVEQFFEGSPTGLALYTALAGAISSIGPATSKVSRSQVAFRRRRAFAFVWRPDRYLSTDVPLVLSIACPFPLRSPRFKEVAHPSRDVWMHHLELRDRRQIDDEVRRWLTLAFEHAE